MHQFPPFAVLTVCAVVAGSGLFWPGSFPLPATDARADGAALVMAVAAATVFGLGRTCFRPNMPGNTSGRRRRGGCTPVRLSAAGTRGPR